MEIKCRNCGYAMDSHTEVMGAVTNPKDGDLSVCLSCGYLGRFRNGHINPLSHNQYAALNEETKTQLLKIEKVRKRVMDTYGVTM